MNPDNPNEGYGVGGVRVNDTAVVDNVVVFAKATVAGITVDGTIVSYVGELHTMGPAISGTDNLLLNRNIRLGGMRRALDRRTGKLRFRYPG